MASILQASISAAREELAFNSLCREMAKDNASLAYNYIKSALMGVFTHPVNGSTTSVALKGKCINLIKAPLLLLRTPLLYLPLTNRVTQLALRFLSPKLSTACLNSSDFKESEVKARYSKDTRREFIADHFKDKIKDKEKIEKKDLEISLEMTALTNKLGFNPKDCSDIFLNVLAQSPEIQCSINLKKEVNRHRKNNQG